MLASWFELGDALGSLIVGASDLDGSERRNRCTIAAIDAMAPQERALMDLTAFLARAATDDRKETWPG